LEWLNRIERPLFVALLVLRGTPLYDAVEKVNDKFDEMKTEFEVIRQSVKDGRRPATEGMTSMGNSVVNRRNEHLMLARLHFSLSRADAEDSVRR
jgi:hypothetical protein